jgi:hypothetical protein
VIISIIVQAKIKIKHKLNWAEINKAFENWIEGPVELEPYEQKELEKFESGEIKYTFIAKIKNDYRKTGVYDHIKVVLFFSEDKRN